MKFVKFIYDNDKVSFDDFSLITLIIENKTELHKYLEYLNCGCIEGEDYWKIYEDSQIMDIEDYSDYIPNIFCLDLNTKKNLNALYKILKRSYFDFFKEQIRAIKQILEHIIGEISEDFDLELESESTISEDDIFKAFNLRLNNDCETRVESLFKYILAINKLRGTVLFYVGNLHMLFDSEDIANLLKETSYAGIKLINLEFNSKFTKCKDEITYILDNDFCFLK